MADRETVRHLARGVAEWNAFRADTRSPVRLTGIEIRHADLRGADFHEVDFDKATFTNVGLRDADFRRARLNGVRALDTSFDGARFAGAEFKGTDLWKVCLRDCDLTGIEAFELKIRDAVLTGAKLDRGRWRSSHVYNSDLRGVTASDTAWDARMMLKRVRVEPARLAELAAAGCALELPNLSKPEDWLDCEAFTVRRDEEEFGVILHAHEKFWIPEGRWDFFISYASTDRDTVAKPLAGALIARDQRPWLDGLELNPGDDLPSRIGFGIAGSVHGIVILSRDYFGREWTEREFNALAHKRLFVVLHGLRVADLPDRPELRDRVLLTTDLPIDQIADRLVQAIGLDPAAARRAGPSERP